MTVLTKEKVDILGGVDGIKTVLKDLPNDVFALWYVHDYSEALGKFGYFTDKFIVGKDKPSKFHRVTDLKRYLLKTEEFKNE